MYTIPIELSWLRGRHGHDFGGPFSEYETGGELHMHDDCMECTVHILLLL